MKLKDSFLYFLFFFCSLYSAQDSFTDDLKNQLAKDHISITEKFKIYNELTEYYRVSDQYPAAEKYIQQQLELAKKEHNYAEQVKALTQSGIIKINQSQYDKVPPIIDAADAIV